MTESEYTNWIDATLSGAKTIEEATDRLKQLFRRAENDTLDDLDDTILSSLRRDAIAIAAEYFGDLSYHTASTDYVDRLPWAIRHNVTRSDGTLGVVMESAPLKTYREPADTALSLARVVLLCVECYDQSPSNDALHDVERNWLMLRGFTWSAVGHGRSQHWLDQVTLSSDGIEPIKRALLEGNRIHNNNTKLLESSDFQALHVTHWETGFKTADLVEWLEAAYKAAVMRAVVTI